MTSARCVALAAALVVLASCSSQRGGTVAPSVQSNGAAENTAEAVADRVQRCETTHELHQAREMRQGDPTSVAEYGTYDWVSCTWPPARDADADGFTRVHIDVLAGPGEGNASDANVRDVISGPCKVFTVTYDYGHMGDMKHGTPVNVPLGMVTSIDDLGRPWTPQGNNGEWPFYPRRDQINVLRNDHYLPVEVVCGAASAPA